MAIKTLLREESMWPVCRRQGGKAQVVGSLAVWVKLILVWDVMRKLKVLVYVQPS